MDGASGGLCRGGGLAWRAAGPGAVEVGAGGAGGAARLELPEGPGAPARVAAAGLLGGGAAVAAARGGALRVWERAEGGAAADFEVPGGAGAVLAVGATATGVIVMLGLESGELARVDVGTSQGALSPRVLPRGKPRVSGGGSGAGGSMLTPLKRLSSMVVETLHSRPGGGSDFGIVALDWTPEWEDPRARDLAVLRGMSAELWRVDMEAGGGAQLVWVHDFTSDLPEGGAVQPLDVRLASGKVVALFAAGDRSGARRRVIVCTLETSADSPPQLVEAAELGELPLSAAQGSQWLAPGSVALRCSAGLQAVMILSKGHAWAWTTPLAGSSAAPLLLTTNALDAGIPEMGPQTKESAGELFTVLTMNGTLPLSALLVRQSVQMLDALPKHFGVNFQAGKGSPAIDAQLAEKARRHEAYLQLIGTGNWLSFLGLAEQCEMFEGSQKVAVLQALRERHNDLQDGGGGGDVVAAGAGHALPLEVVAAVVEAHGQIVKDADRMLLERPNWEVCYSRVSAAGSLFEAMARLLPDIVSKYSTEGTCPATREDSVCLNTLISVALRTFDIAEFVRTTQTPHVSPNLKAVAQGKSNGLWLSTEPVRLALLALCRACISLRQAAVGSNRDLARDVIAQLHPLCLRLLQSQRAAVLRSPMDSAEWLSVSRSYNATKDEILGALLDIATEDMSTELMEATAAVAEEHRCYSALFRLCWSTQDDARLHHYMSFLLPDSGTKRLGDTLGFPNFVFRELHMRGRFKKLMALPDAFDQQLLAYLKMNPDESEPACDMLHCQLWKLGNWLEAAEHQKRLASISSTLKARRKYLVYAQASLRALKQPDAAHLAQYSNANTLMSDINLHLEVLDMQLGLGGDENQPPMPLGELAKGLLQSQTPYKMFRLMTIHPEIQGHHAGVVEAAWLRAMGDPVWEDIASRRASDLMSDEGYRQTLQRTPVYQAAFKCKGAAQSGPVVLERNKSTMSGGAFQAVLDAFSLGNGAPTPEPRFGFQKLQY